MRVLFISLADGFNNDLFNYLFGSVMAVSRSDVWTILFITLVVSFVLVVFYKEFFFLSFDEEQATVSGLNRRFFHILFIVMNQLFLDIVDITKSELIYERLNTLADQSFLMERMYDLLNQSLQSKRVEVNHYEDKETILHLRALPKPKNLSINLFTSLVYASNSIIISM